MDSASITKGNDENTTSEEANTAVELFRKLLYSISQIDQSGASSKSANCSAQKRIGKQLSQLFLKKNGIFSFLMACDDLGGESFWLNSAALSAVVKLFVTKPAHVRSAEKYHSFVLRNLLLIFKNPVWTKRISLLFTLTVEEFGKTAPLSVQVEIVDKLLNPFKFILERGNLLLSTGNESSQSFYAKLATNDGVKLSCFGGERLLWLKRIDEALWTLARWLEALPTVGPFTGHENFLQIFSFWLHLLGQAEALGINVETESTSDETSVDRLTAPFIKDLRLVCSRVINCFSTSKTQAEFVLKNCLLRNGELTESVELTHFAYFALDFCKDHEVSSKISSKIQIVSETSVEERGVKEIPLKYGNVKLFVRNEPFSLQDLIDFKFSALEPLILQRPRDESCKLLTALLSILYAECRSSNPSRINGRKAVKCVEDFRFLSLSENFLSGHVAKSEDSMFLPHYLLTKSLNILSNFDFDFDNMAEANYLELFQMAELNGACYKKEINDAENFENAKISVDSKMSNVNSKKPRSECLEAILREVDEYTMLSGDSLDMVRISCCGAALVELAKALRTRDKTIFRYDHDFERVYDRAIEKLESADTFIFLAAINVIAELAYWQTNSYLPRMIELFLHWVPARTSTDSDDDDYAETDKYADESAKPKLSSNSKRAQRSKDEVSVFKGKMGEAIAKVARQLGDISPVYFDRVSNALLGFLRNSTSLSESEILRCSALSALSDLIHACHGRYFDRILQELLLCVTQILESNRAKSLERRGAIHLLRSMLQSANDQRNGTIFEVFLSSLAPVTAQLKRLWRSDYDEVVRLHAELALIEIEEAVARAFGTNEQLTIGGSFQRICLK